MRSRSERTLVPPADQEGAAGAQPATTRAHPPPDTRHAHKHHAHHVYTSQHTQPAHAPHIHEHDTQHTTHPRRAWDSADETVDVTDPHRTNTDTADAQRTQTQRGSGQREADAAKPQVSETRFVLEEPPDDL